MRGQVARRGNSPGKIGSPRARRAIRGARLDPVGVVERELTRPDGTKVRVRVPVYPPFRLEPGSAERPAEKRRGRAED